LQLLQLLKNFIFLVNFTTKLIELIELKLIENTIIDNF